MILSIEMLKSPGIIGIRVDQPWHVQVFRDSHKDGDFSRDRQQKRSQSTVSPHFHDVFLHLSIFYIFYFGVPFFQAARHYVGYSVNDGSGMPGARGYARVASRAVMMGFRSRAELRRGDYSENSVWLE